MHRRWGRAGPADLAFVVVLALAAVYVIHEGHGNMFFYDEWGWIETRRDGLSAVLDSYNQHMEIAPLAIYQLMLHAIGLNHYHWFRLLALVGHLLVVVAVYLYARRRIGPLALLVAIPVAFLGAGWEFIVWGINFGFTTSMALGIAALIWSDRPGGSPAVTCLLLIASLLFSETAVLFSIGLAVEFTWQDRSLRRAWVWALPIILYIAWYLGYYQPYLAEHNVLSIPTFGARLAAAAAGGMFGASLYGGWLAPGVGFGWVVLVLIVILLVTRLVRARAWSPRFLAVVLTALGYWTLVAFGRAQLGEPNASRYIYTGAVLLLLVILESLRGMRITLRSTAAVGGTALVALIGGLLAFPGGEATQFQGSTSEAAELTAVQVMRDFVPAGMVVDPHWSPAITPGAYLAAAADLRSTGALTIPQLLVSGEEERSSADLVLGRGGDLITTPAPAPTPTKTASAPPVELQLKGSLTRSPACLTYTPAGAGSTLDVTLPSGAALDISIGASPAGDPPTQVFARRFAAGYENVPIVSTATAARERISTRRDGSALPWHVRVSPWAPVQVCTVSGG